MKNKKNSSKNNVTENEFEKMYCDKTMMKNDPSLQSSAAKKK